MCVWDLEFRGGRARNESRGSPECLQGCVSRFPRPAVRLDLGVQILGCLGGCGLQVSF